MSNIFTRKDVKKIKKQLKGSSQFNRSDKDKATVESIDRLVGLRKGGAKSRQVVKNSGLSSSDRRGVMNVMSNDFGKPSIETQKNRKDVSASKPKTSWWQAIKGGNSKSQGGSSTGGSDLSSVRSRPGSPSFTSSFGSGSGKSNFTSNRGDSLGPNVRSPRGSQSKSARRSSLPSGPRNLH